MYLSNNCWRQAASYSEQIVDLMILTACVECFVSARSNHIFNYFDELQHQSLLHQSYIHIYIAQTNLCYTGSNYTTCNLGDAA